MAILVTHIEDIVMGAWDEAGTALAAAETLAGELDTPLQLPEVYSSRALLELATG